MNLETGMRELGVPCSDVVQRQLTDYLDMLARWNKRFNLTAVRDPHEMVVRHLLDSLAISPFVTGDRLIDVGTGGGLPGVPLAILFPEKEFFLLDSNGKKTRFLTQLKAELALRNIRVVHSRVEQYRPDRSFDAVLSRAFASLNDMIAGCEHLLSDGGSFLAMKGQRPTEELELLETAGYKIQVHALDVPDLEEDRCLVTISANSNTSQKLQQA